MKRILVLISSVLIFFACKKDIKKVTDIEIEEKTTTELEELIGNTDGWKSLFDGKTFSGWHVYLTEDAPTSEWKIIDSSMVFVPEMNRTKAGNNLISDKKYTDFVLSLEWKNTKMGNSGVFWSVLENPKYPEPYESGPEVQILDKENYPDPDPSHHSGGVFGLIPIKQDMSKPLGEWNHFVIYINHKSNEGKVWLNGTKVSEFPLHGEVWDAMIANTKFADWEDFGKHHTGHIGLQDHGTEIAFRNLKIKEL